MVRWHSKSILRCILICAKLYFSCLEPDPTWPYPTQPVKWINLTLSSRDMVDFKAPSGCPKGKTKRKLVRWRSKSILKRSLTWAKLSFSCWVTVPTPSCLEKHWKNVNIRNTLCAFLSCSGDLATNFEITNSWFFI